MKHSSYFGGQVQSLGLDTDKGYATVGVIEPGRFIFSTSQEETMVVVSGTLKYKLPEKGWETVNQGGKFVVAPKISFEVEAATAAAYICYYK